MATHSSILAWEITWTIARQTPLSMGFSRQKYWRGLLCPPLLSGALILNSPLEERSAKMHQKASSSSDL